MPSPSSSRRESVPQERGVEWGQRALVVDDEPSVRKALTRELTRHGMGVIAVASGQEALRSLAEEEPPVVIADLRMPGMDGLELLREIHERYPRTQRILVSADLDVEHMIRATNEAQVAQVILKPIDPGALVAAVRNALGQRRLIDEHARMGREIERLQALLSELHADVKAAVSERERLLVDTKTLLERTIDAIANPLSVVDSQGTVRAANRAWAREAAGTLPGVIGEKCYAALMGRSTSCPGCPLGSPAAQTQPILELEIPARQAGRAWGAVLHRVSLEGLHTKDSLHAGQAAPGGNGWVCAYHDVTEERSRQAQLQQNDRMVAVGELAAGVAHELNNPLGGILALSQVALRDLDLNEDDNEILIDIEDAAKRCTRIIKSLLLFARGPSGSSDILFAVGECVQHAVDLTQGPIKAAQALVEVVIEPDLPQVFGAPSLLQQALVSLISNAAEALLTRARHGEPGTVTVRALHQADEVWIEVADDGPGVSKEVQPHIFTPFVTTQDSVSGAGFGLALVYRITERLDGRCEIQSGPEGGTTARIVLPAAAVKTGAASNDSNESGAKG